MKQPDSRPAKDDTSSGKDRPSEERWKWNRVLSPSLTALVVLLVVGVAYLVAAIQLPLGSLGNPDTGFFPLAIGCLLVVSVAAAILEQVFTGKSEQSTETTAEDAAGARWRVPVILAAALAYVLVANILGHIVSATVVSAVVIQTTGERPWWQSLVFGILIGLGSYLVFDLALGLPLPGGLL